MLLNNEVAAWLWTPPRIWVALSKLLAVPHCILFLVVYPIIFARLVEEIFESEGVRNYDVASELLALGKDAHLTHIFHFVAQVVNPASFAELMAASQAVCLSLWINFFELTKADMTSFLVIFCKSLIDFWVLI